MLFSSYTSRKFKRLANSIIIRNRIWAHHFLRGPKSGRNIKTWLIFLRQISIAILAMVVMMLTLLNASNILSITQNAPLNYVSNGKSRSLPLCTTGMMDKTITNVDAKKNLHSHFPLNHKDDCRFHLYSPADLVNCIEILSSNTTNNSTNTLTNGGKIKMHVAFIGDSRIRHMYGNFILQLLPFIEESCPTPLAKLDICVEMPLMDSYFKFHWLPHYNDTYYELLKSWVDGENPDFPNYLVIGSTAHHLGPINEERKFHNSSFEGNVTRLAPLLAQLTEHYGTRIVWWNDDLLIDSASLPVIELNKMIRQTVNINKVPLQMWDSTNDLFMEYFRICNNIEYGRKVPWINPRFTANPTSWLNCYDIFHSPQAYAINQMQLIANDLCNSVMKM